MRKHVLGFLLWATCLPCTASHLLVDEGGRKVLVPDHPHRILCLVPSITDSVFAIGAGDDVVGISDYVEYPAEAKKKPSVGSISNPSMETILSLHPDLVLGTPHANQQAVFDQLQQLNIAVYMVDPHGIDGILRSIADIGEATGHKQQADKLEDSLRSRINTVRLSVHGKPLISVFMPVSYDPIFTIGHGAFITEIIAAAGGRSITDDIKQEWPQISMEAVVARAPKGLLMMRGGRTNLDSLKTRPGWNVLPAVRSGTVYYVDRRVNFPSPVAIDALEDLAKQFHP